MNKSYIFDLGITAISFEKAVSTLISRARKREFTSVFLANVHMLIEAKQDSDFKNIFDSADFVFSDGVPICFALKKLNNINQERIAGMDLLPSILQQAAANQISVYFYGSTDEILSKSITIAQQKYSHLQIAGYYSPPFRQLTANELEQVIDKINNSGAGLIVVALGCPKQEKFIFSVRNRINGVMIGFGGALPVFADTVSRAPKIMQKFGLEWSYRLLQEPKRLFKRYLKTNTKFILLFLKNYFKK